MSSANSIPPIQGISVDCHNLSHYGKNPEKLEKFKIIEPAQLVALRDLLAKLKTNAGLGGALLDHTSVLYGSNFGNAASHNTRNLPIRSSAEASSTPATSPSTNRTTLPSRRSTSPCSSA